MNHDQHRMECYDIHDWQANFHHGPCLPCTIRAGDDDPDDGLTFESEMAVAREEYRNCLLLCETDYCKGICKRQYDETVSNIYSKYGLT